MKKILIPLLLITFILWTSMLQLKNKEKKSIKKLTLNLQEGNPPTLHPHLGVDLRSRCLFLALYEPLMRRNQNGDLTPAAAQKVEIDDSQKKYTFHLRPHSWSDGKAVTSKHFATAWRYALDPASKCIRSDLFYVIKNAEQVKKGILPPESLKIFTPDEKTLVVELDHPTPYFLELTATSFFSPLYEATDQEPRYFNGPFKVKEWMHEQRLILCKNPIYWDFASVDLQEIHFTMVKDPMTALAMYEKGELDLIGDPFSTLPLDSLPSLKASGELKTKLISRIFYLLLNTNSYPLHVKSLRKALSLSIDRDALINHLFFGELPTSSPLPKTLSLLEEKELKERSDEAASYFEQALSELQLTRENFPKIVLNYAALSGQKSFAEFLQEQWRKKLGIKVEILCSDWNVHSVNLRKKNYQMGTLHLTTLYQDPMFYLDLFRDKTLFSNYTGWEDQSYRSLLEQSEQTVDKKKRSQFLRQAEKQLFDEMPTIPIFTQNFQYLVKKPINLMISDLGIYDFKWTRVNNSIQK